MPRAIGAQQPAVALGRRGCSVASVRRSATLGAQSDRSGREAIISCGAVLDHLRIAMVAAGWQAHIERFPNPNNEIIWHRSNSVHSNSSPTLSATGPRRYLQRRTDRLPLDRPTYWASFEPVLRSCVDENVAMLDVLSDDVRPQLVEASQLTEGAAPRRCFIPCRTAMVDIAFRVIRGCAARRAGIRLRTAAGRRGAGFPLPQPCATAVVDVAADWSKVLVLSTAEDTRTDVLRCGEALSTVLLECTMAGMATCTLTHLIELDDSRDIVRELIVGRGEPQVLIRVGIAPPMDDLPAATPRRPLDDVLEIR